MMYLPTHCRRPVKLSPNSFNSQIMHTLITQGIRVSVQTAYQADYSRPHQSKFIHSYRVSIENTSSTTVQLLRRYWQVQDSSGDQQEVEGEGVIGQQPILQPGENHQYVSWCPLTTEIGRMWGSYQMVDLETNQLFTVHIPRFDLIVPFKLN